MENVKRIFDLLQLYRDEFSANDCVFGYKKQGKWLHVPASKYVIESDRISCALIASGLIPGDKVATIMNNMPEWNFLDMGILQAGCVHVPVYHSLSSDSYRFIFEDSGVRLIVVGCQNAYERVKPAVDAMERKIPVYSLEPGVGQDSWPDFLENGKDSQLFGKLQIIRDQVQPEDLATLIYTSGTTGHPKGVMLSHANLVSNFKSVSLILGGMNVSRALSFLPLCHVYERMLNYMYQYLAVSVFYSENPDRLRDCLKEVKPDMFCAVPRVIEKTYATLLRTGKNLSGFRKPVFIWALKLGFKYEIETAQKPLNRLIFKIADMLVYRKWRLAFGNKVRFIVSGGAPLNPGLARVFWAAGMKVIEGYGLTETSPVIATGNFEPDGVRFGTVGKVIPGIELRISGDGEILCKGPNVMMGYHNRPDQTSEAIDADGWFHTGDIGELVDGKYLRITDRKKEIFKTSGGKYIAPQVVENKLKESPFIENVLVIGENKNYPSALIVPNFDYLRSWCRAKGYAYTTDSEMISQKIVIERIQRDVSMLNLALDHPSQVKKFILMDCEWTVQTGELSFTMKVRRTYMQERFASLISTMYPVNPEIILQKKGKKKKKKKGKKS